MSTAAQSIADHVTARNQIVLAIANQARAAYPDVADQSRIGKALNLIYAGNITLHADGTASVRSEKSTATYRVNGECQCMDYDRAPQHRCKHRYAVSILKKALCALKRARYAHDAQTGEPGLVWPSADNSALHFLPAQGTQAEVVTLAAVVLCGFVVER